MSSTRTDRVRPAARALLDATTTRRAFVAGSAATAAAAMFGGGFAAAAGHGGARAGIARNQDVQAGGTLTYGLGFDFDGHLDPQQTNFDSVIRVMLNVCEPLVWMPTATDFYPALAESWEVSQDGLEYTFHLKQGVTFTDGTPFNAQAVQFTYDRVVALDKQTAAAVAAGTPAAAVPTADPTKIITPGQSHDQIGTYDHSEIIDDHTIKMVLTRPFSPFLSGLNGYLGIVSPTAVQTMGIAEFDRKPVGTGPYVVQEWVEADHVTLVKNPNFNWGSSFFKHQGAAYFDQIIYKIIPDNAVRTGTLTSGETQYIDAVDPLQLEDLQGNSDLQVIQQGQPGSGWTLLVNVARPDRPVADINVRTALHYAVDKAALNQAAFGGANAPAASALMKPTFAYEPKTETLFSFDTAKAESLLDQAGWVKNGDIREKDGNKLQLYFPIQDRPDDKAMATALQGAFRAVGIDMQVDPMERDAYRTKVRTEKDYDFSFMWFSYADPDVLRTIFYSKNKDAFNRAQYDNPDVDKMLEDAAASADPEERKNLYSQIQIKVLQDAVCIPLVDTIVYNAKQKKLQGDFLDFLASYVWMNDAHFEG
ncbi:MAG TPA: ABC transporter substrate-binding protein [Thermomicrobiales bacterium]|jgi:peptide/nickel transport system substrate-binding protein